MRLGYSQQSLERLIVPGDFFRETVPHCPCARSFRVLALSARPAIRLAGHAKTVRSKIISRTAVAADRAIPRRAHAGGDRRARAAGNFLFRERGWRRLENE